MRQRRLGDVRSNRSSLIFLRLPKHVDRACCSHLGGSTPRNILRIASKSGEICCHLHHVSNQFRSRAPYGVVIVVLLVAWCTSRIWGRPLRHAGCNPTMLSIAPGLVCCGGVGGARRIVRYAARWQPRRVDLVTLDERRTTASVMRTCRMLSILDRHTRIGAWRGL